MISVLGKVVGRVGVFFSSSDAGAGSIIVFGAVTVSGRRSFGGETFFSTGGLEHDGANSRTSSGSQPNDTCPRCFSMDNLPKESFSTQGSESMNKTLGLC